MTLFEAQTRVGGQLNLARNVPGKEEFDETIRYWRRLIDKHGVTMKLSTRPAPPISAGFDEVVIATGVTPRTPESPASIIAKCVSYVEILSGKAAPARASPS